LLGNAVKFTSNGSITIQCAQNEDSTEISVSDTGCGMDPATVNNLNNAIFSESRRGTLGEKGTGLGFILAAEHIAKNGGAFEVKSTPNAGTTISVKFKNKQ
jgi:signal transduction histidine kinase